MKYISPFKLLALDTVLSDSKELGKIKKQILAEFELAQETVIDIRGYTIEKTTALKLLDELENPKVEAFHYNVFQDKNLLLFLEKGVRGRFSDNDIYNEADFLNFVSPYFREIYNLNQYRAFIKNDFNLIGKMASMRMLISNSDLDGCYQKTCRLIVQKIEEIDTIGRNFNFRTTERTLSPYYNHQLINSLNALPKYFSPYLDRYASSLLTLAIEINNNHSQHRLAYSIVREIRFVKASSLVKSMIEEIYKQMPRYNEYEVPASSISDTSSNNYWKFIYPLVVICIFIAGPMRACKNSSGSKKPIINEKIKVANQRDVTNELIELLKAHHFYKEKDLIDSIKQVDEPETGFTPYKHLISNYTVLKGDVNYLSIQNDAAYPVIGILTNRSELINTFYIRSGESISKMLLGTRSAELSFYFGKDWDDSVEITEGSVPSTMETAIHVLERRNNGQTPFLLNGAFQSPMPGFAEYLPHGGYLKIYFPATRRGFRLDLHIESEDDKLTIDHGYSTMEMNADEILKKYQEHKL